jgi:hypothetical protein
MAYRWSLEGPAFEFPTPYGIENRVLKLRAGLLLLLALVITWLALRGGEGEAAVLQTGPEPGSPWPHLVVAMGMVVLAVVELVRAHSQRGLMLVPGQPASLMGEVRRESQGSSANADWLTQALGSGIVMPVEPVGVYNRLLLRLVPNVASAPQSLHAHLRVRLSHVLLSLGLVGLFGLSWLLLKEPAAHVLVALAYGCLGALVVGRSLFTPEKPALGPAALVVVLALALLATAGAWWLARFAAPYTERLVAPGLPLATAVLLGSGLLFEVLALLAARVHAQPTLPGSAATEQVPVNYAGDPQALMQELDRELLRRWTEGIPNRRYAWVPPQVDAQSTSGSFSAVVLEESQPLHLAKPMPRRSLLAEWASRSWLWMLVLASLVWTLLGGALFVRLAYQHMADGSAPWNTAGVALALVLAGGYALRVAHLLWSRIEVESNITWLTLGGTALRAPGERDFVIDGMQLRCCMAQARSVFFAAAPHTPGSRALLSLAPRPAAATAWVQHLQNFARASQTVGQGAVAAAQAARLRAREERAEQQAAAASAPRVPARFCSACGTPVLSGARFCQQCGNSLV